MPSTLPRRSMHEKLRRDEATYDSPADQPHSLAQGQRKSAPTPPSSAIIGVLVDAAEVITIEAATPRIPKTIFSAFPHPEKKRTSSAPKTPANRAWPKIPWARILPFRTSGSAVHHRKMEDSFGHADVRRASQRHKSRPRLRSPSRPARRPLRFGADIETRNTHLARPIESPSGLGSSPPAGTTGGRRKNGIPPIR